MADILIISYLAIGIVVGLIVKLLLDKPRSTTEEIDQAMFSFFCAVAWPMSVTIGVVFGIGYLWYRLLRVIFRPWRI